MATKEATNPDKVVKMRPGGGVTELLEGLVVLLGEPV